jgi:hypothetical protein
MNGYSISSSAVSLRFRTGQSCGQVASRFKPGEFASIPMPSAERVAHFPKPNFVTGF